MPGTCSGCWLIRSGKQDLAIEYIGYAIRLNPGVAAFHSNLGVAYRALGKLDEAAACWRRALELNPDYVDALNNLGNVLREQGQLDQAVACYRRALELNPDNPTTYYNLGTALSDQGLLARRRGLLPPGTGAETGLSRCARTTWALP